LDDSEVLIKMDIITIIIIIIFLIGLFIAYKVGSKAGSFRRDKWWEGEIPSYRKDAILKSRAVLGGHFSEQLAPFLPNFPFKPNECLFMGKPIDLIVFQGMDEKNINKITFVEVKSGKARLSPQEKNLKEAIEKKRVNWVEYRIPEALTKKGNIEEKVAHIIGETKEKIKEFLCESCGRLINHKGKCLACNIKDKKKEDDR